MDFFFVNVFIITVAICNHKSLSYVLIIKLLFYLCREISTMVALTHIINNVYTKKQLNKVNYIIPDNLYLFIFL